MMTKDISELILEELRDHRAESRERHEKLSDRVSTVEAWQNNANGKITMFGAFGIVIGGVLSWVVSIFKHS